MATQTLLLDLHEVFMEFKLDVGQHMTELHPQEVIQSCTAIFGFMVEGAVTNGPLPRLTGHEDAVGDINAKIEKYYPSIRRAIEEWELTGSVDRIKVDASIPARTLIHVTTVPSTDWSNQLVDRIIEDIAEGVSYPRHIRAMIDSEYPNAITHLQQE